MSIKFKIVSPINFTCNTLNGGYILRSRKVWIILWNVRQKNKVIQLKNWYPSPKIGGYDEINLHSCAKVS